MKREQRGREKTEKKQAKKKTSDQGQSKTVEMPPTAAPGP